MLCDKVLANKGLPFSIKKQTWAALCASCELEGCCHKLYNAPNILEDEYIDGGIFDWMKARDKNIANNDNTFVHSVRTHWARAHEGDPTGYATRKNNTKCNLKANVEE